ncbi:MAG: adenosine-specific kinase [Nitrososphaerota archaeon]|jgi:adenosine/AMP kinase|nr:adenosine-specific kinase [Nitrososphaerota archaeon]MDG7035970.1 adenosine-specific kinase [Nitrososphaerota archaeon]MDG7039748.1 adenosine-specific kinase [Nitrososphaerota archaeon]MDG7045731.1 adenosine-specific kinase [Nitrososphaerota archaeon]MDG7045985.1 adenosine-specific kinase [Nitrososphaerota archaeon]
MKISGIRIDIPKGVNIILGQSHFIKTVEDIYERLATSMPNIKFGLAFCEASGPSLIRYDGTDKRSITLATDIAKRIAAGHSFVVILNGAYPINVLNRIKDVEEVVGIYCATANSISVITADDDNGRAILGVIDGVRPKGTEDRSSKMARHKLLRDLGYKL